MTMQIVTLGFPIYQIVSHKRDAYERIRALEEFDRKHRNPFDDSTTEGSSSIKPRSSHSKRSGKMCSMASLDKCLEARGNELDYLLAYACSNEFAGENIIFLMRVQDFVKQCQQAFDHTCRSSPEFHRARRAMFRVALNIYVSLVHAKTAHPYPINIESAIYHRLDSIFGPATIIVATQETNRNSSLTSESDVTPWDEPATTDYFSKGFTTASEEQVYPMQPMGNGPLSPRSNKPSRHRSESSECIVTPSPYNAETPGQDEHGQTREDPFQGVQVPAELDEKVFDAAFKSIRYMVWTGTWQNYSSLTRRNSSPGARASRV